MEVYMSTKQKEPFLIEEGITTRQQVWQNKNMLADVLFTFLTNEERLMMLTDGEVRWFWDLWTFFDEIEERLQE